MLRCPFCGAEETDRVELDGARFVVFRCMFSPKVAPGRSDAELDSDLRRTYSGGGGAYFRGMCDALHLHVAKGEGARKLTAGRVPADPP